MEQTALKIQSAFRGKMNLRKKSPKDNSDDDSCEEYDTQNESSPNNPFETSELLESYCEETDKSSDIRAQRSSCYENCYDEHDAFNYNLNHVQVASVINDFDMMQGGGIFPEPSGESTDFQNSSSSGDDGNNPARNSENSYGPNNMMENEKPAKDGMKPIEDEEKPLKSFDFQRVDKNSESAESLYYSLKKNELETLGKTHESNDSERLDETFFEEREDDDDVIIVNCTKVTPRFKYGISMDDRLLGSILSKTSSRSFKKICNDDGFDPLLESAMRNHNFLENHEISSNFEESQSSHNSCDPGDDEDKFDDFCSLNIRKKIMASSITDDSDYFANSKSIVNDDKIHTALETIRSTDSESTTVSGATKVTRVPVCENMFSQPNMSFNLLQSNFSSSIGNNAIDKSLDDFIQLQELHILKEISKEDSTDETLSAEWDKKINGGIIDIKLEQKSFLTVDERRRTLHREDAIQRNSTREDEDVSKSSNASSEAVVTAVSRKSSMDPCVEKLAKKSMVPGKKKNT